MRDDVRYAMSGDVHIAYQVVGRGPIDVVLVPSWISNIEAFWNLPEFAEFAQRIASFSRLIFFDKRGTGLSDPIPTGVQPTIEERTDDLRAVMDAAGSERASLIGLSEGGPICMVFAATYPERTNSIVLWGTFARVVAAPDYPDGGDRDTLIALADSAATLWGQGYMLNFMAPSIADHERVRQRYARLERLGASPAVASALLRLNIEIDVRPVLPAVGVPTLVMHRRDEMFVHVEHGRYIAERIPDARYVELPGVDHLPWIGDADAVLTEIEAFLTGTRPHSERDRVLATVMFVDIVESTRQAAAMGDRAWKKVLDEFHSVAREQLDGFGGTEISTTGDGFLATFDGPARALRCSRALRESIGALGLDIRVGVHTGECERVGSEVRGIAVHIGARVAAEAAPGEVLVSSTVKDLVAGSGIAFDDRGIRTLKGVPDSWHLFAVSE